MSKNKHVLIAGASGLVGQAAMKHFAEAGVKTTAISRRTPRETFGAAHVALDLRDTQAVADFAASQTGVTHLIYAALYEKPGLIAGWQEADQIDTNDAMLRNLMEPLQKAARNLEHVCFLQGTKAYGAHLRPIDIPARENRSEYEHDNFYWKQEAFIREAAGHADWAWTILRPQIIFGEVTGVAMNLIPVLGAYGALLAEAGEPMHFPGGFPTVLEAVDAGLLARVIDWASEAQAARDEIFNVTNGDVFTWRGVWPAITEALGRETGEDRPDSVAERIASGVDTWREIAAREHLSEPDLLKLVGESHHYADFTMAVGQTDPIPPAIVSTIKLRQAGFSEVMDTEAMFTRWLSYLRLSRLLP